MTEGIPLVSKSGLGELILLLQQMRLPLFQIGVLYTCSNDFCTDHHTSHSDVIAISFWYFPRYQPNKMKSSGTKEWVSASDISLRQVKFIFNWDYNQNTSGPVWTNIQHKFNHGKNIIKCASGCFGLQDKVTELVIAKRNAQNVD